MREHLHPYEQLDPRCFWRTGVTAQSPLEIDDLYRKKFAISSEDRIAAAGSCFAQHISHYLTKEGFNVIDEEPAPPPLDAKTAREFGYGLYSARYGNIYTASQLLQLTNEALGHITPAHPVWQKEQRYFDAQRPSVEPEGFARPEHVTLHRQHHLAAVRRVLQSTDIFIFTFGLTEAWIDRQTETVYPTAPGTIAGQFDPAVYCFKNYTFSETYNAFASFSEIIKEINPNARFIITVSPVPLTATASGNHVLAATTYSKSVLRACAGELYLNFADVDYFPSYELIATPFSRAIFYSANLRTVADSGVAAAMRVFFAEHGGVAKPVADDVAISPSRQQQDGISSDEVVCEEVLLDAFAPKA